PLTSAAAANDSSSDPAASTGAQSTVVPADANTGPAAEAAAAESGISGSSTPATVARAVKRRRDVTRMVLSSGRMKFRTRASHPIGRAERTPRVKKLGQALVSEARSEEHTSELQSRENLVC